MFIVSNDFKDWFIVLNDKSNIMLQFVLRDNDPAMPTTDNK